MTTASYSLTALTAQITSAYCANNTIGAEQLPGLIQQIYQALAATDEPAAVADKPVPAVPPKRSVFPDYIVCLEDGKKLKMLKRYLQATHGMTPDEYRARWGLPRDYPMVAPNYTQKRSEVAKQMGLGRKDQVASDPIGAGTDVAADAEAEAVADVPEVQHLPERRRRRKVA